MHFGVLLVELHIRETKYFFMFLDLMGENLPWRNIDSRNEKEFLECKKKCLSEPEKYLFLKPQRYMNLSGTVIQEYLNYFKIDPKDILIICDDLDTILVVGPFYVVPIFAMVIWIIGMFR